MDIIDFNTIQQLNISPLQCVEWVHEAFKRKYETQLPCKVSIKMENDVFVNTMPSYLPYFDRFGVKVVTRYPERIPSLQSDILLYDASSGKTLALMDGVWITAMRTGAVAALSITTFCKKNTSKYAFIGLGNTARSTLVCLNALLEGKEMDIYLLAYKDQEIDFIKRFSEFQNLHFKVFESADKMISDSDVVISCVTAANSLFAKDEAYPEGILVIPVHTRGFQNCDIFFDKIYGDDTGHVCGFKYFDQFRYFNEFSKVLLGEDKGREREEERILSYNIGISLHDIFFASKIYDLLRQKEEYVTLFDEPEKFWI